jgi:hypothetical protein
VLVWHDERRKGRTLPFVAYQTALYPRARYQGSDQTHQGFPRSEFVFKETKHQLLNVALSHARMMADGTCWAKSECRQELMILTISAEVWQSS